MYTKTKQKEAKTLSNIVQFTVRVGKRPFIQCLTLKKIVVSNLRNRHNILIKACKIFYFFLSYRFIKTGRSFLMCLQL